MVSGWTITLMSPLHSTPHAVGDGEQALRFLRRTGEFTGAPRPSLILLDLNLPRRNGLEVLAELKADPDLLTIPVVIFSTSQAETDVAASAASDKVCPRGSAPHAP